MKPQFPRIAQPGAMFQPHVLCHLSSFGAKLLPGRIWNPLYHQHELVKWLILQTSNRKIQASRSTVSRFKGLLRHSFELLCFLRPDPSQVLYSSEGRKTWPDAAYHAATASCAVRVYGSPVSGKIWLQWFRGWAGWRSNNVRTYFCLYGNQVRK